MQNNMSEFEKNKRTGSESATHYDIPVEGSLGLLALGARGIIEWRKVRDAQSEKITKGKSNE